MGGNLCRPVTDSDEEKHCIAHKTHESNKEETENDTAATELRQFEPKKLGLNVDFDSGRIRNVRPGFQAEKKV
eukprot:UN13848